MKSRRWSINFAWKVADGVKITVAIIKNSAGARMDILLYVDVASYYGQTPNFSDRWCKLAAIAIYMV